MSHIPDLNGDPLPRIPQLMVHTDGVAQLLSNLKVNKATGPDNLSLRFLQEIAYKIAPILVLIFQASLDQGILPSVWKSAAVVPVFKKRKQIRYRPVSLTCICCKILEHIIRIL